MGKNKGFTLVEMLIVIGIMGILASVMVVSLSHMKKTALQAQAQSLVTEVATALNILLQQERQWPDEILEYSKETEGGCVPEVCAVFQSKKLMDISTYKQGAIGTTINEDSLDRFGILDPYGRAALKKVPKCQDAGRQIPDGSGTYKDHRIQYRVDKNYDGFVDSSEGAPKGMKVRASVIVWSRGPDGKDAERAGGKFPGDDRLSWSVAGTAE
ncbi:MAG: type II secretion system protein [Kiritimatiellae bacterium]|nr:type II secretion system protein [Kiritimatiellia bacterium]